MRDRIIAATLAAMLIAGGVLFAQSDGQNQAARETPAITQNKARPGTVFAVVNSESELSKFAQKARTAGLQGVLESRGPYTVFAPTNEAFEVCAETEIQKLSDKGKLKIALQNHIVVGTTLTYDDLIKMSGQSLTTVMGDQLPITIENRVVWVGSAKITGSEMTADNGVVHVVDEVLMPQMLYGRSMK